MRYSIDKFDPSIGEEYYKDIWIAKTEKISEERTKVLDFIDKGGHAYGFSTFLGHFDHHSSTVEDSKLIFNAHLVGNPKELPPRLSRLITAAKLCQLSSGGSGISADSYKKILGSLDDSVAISVPEFSSYGSGDVVPGAWWTAGIFGRDTEFKKGDLISLINGNFISVGFSMYAYFQLKETMENLLNQTYDFRNDILHFQSKSQNTQLPVSLRDLKPVEHRIGKSLASLEESINQSLNRPSANPMFKAEKSFHAESNSSFLNFDLSISIKEGMETLKIASSYTISSLRYWTVFWEKCIEDPHETVQLIQPPKIAKSMLDNLTILTGGSLSYIQSESDYIEDISDGSLIQCATLLEAIEIGREIYSLAEKTRSDSLSRLATIKNS